MLLKNKLWISHKLAIVALMTASIGCGPSVSEKISLADSECRRLAGMTDETDEELLSIFNDGRSSVGLSDYEGTVDVLRDSIELGLCPYLLLDNPVFVDKYSEAIKKSLNDEQDQAPIESIGSEVAPSTSTQPVSPEKQSPEAEKPESIGQIATELASLETAGEPTTIGVQPGQCQDGTEMPHAFPLDQVDLSGVSIASKDDYETEANFEKRVERERQSAEKICLYDQLTTDYDAERESYGASWCNRGKEISDDTDTRVVSKSGTNAMGAQWEWIEEYGRKTTVRWSCEFFEDRGFHIPLAIAKKHRDNATFVVEIEVPPQVPRTFYSSDYPEWGKHVVDRSSTERFSGEVSRIWLVNSRTGEFITDELFSDFIAEKEKERREQQIAKEARERAKQEAKELADAMSEYRAAAQRELRKYYFSVNTSGPEFLDRGLVIDPRLGSVELVFNFRTVGGVMKSYREALSLLMDSVKVDFKDPSIPDFAHKFMWPDSDIYLGASDIQREFFPVRLSLRPENRISREQLTLLISKFGTDSWGRVSPPKSAYEVILKIEGISSSRSVPWEFECKNFDVLERNDLCWGKDRAEFEEPLVITF